MPCPKQGGTPAGQNQPAATGQQQPAAKTPAKRAKAKGPGADYAEMRAAKEAVEDARAGRISRDDLKAALSGLSAQQLNKLKAHFKLRNRPGAGAGKTASQDALVGHATGQHSIPAKPKPKRKPGQLPKTPEHLAEVADQVTAAIAAGDVAEANRLSDAFRADIEKAKKLGFRGLVRWAEAITGQPLPSRLQKPVSGIDMDRILDHVEMALDGLVKARRQQAAQPANPSQAPASASPPAPTPAPNPRKGAQKQTPADPAGLKRQIDDLTDEKDLDDLRGKLDAIVDHAAANLTGPDFLDWVRQLTGLNYKYLKTKAAIASRLKSDLASNLYWKRRAIQDKAAEEARRKAAAAQAAYDKLAKHPDYLEHVRFSKQMGDKPLTPKEWHDFQNQNHSPAPAGPDAEKARRDDLERQPKPPAPARLGSTLRPGNQKHNAVNIRAVIEHDLTADQADEIISSATGGNRNELEDLAREFGVQTHSQQQLGSAGKREWRVARDPDHIRGDLVAAMLKHTQDQHAEFLSRQRESRRRKKRRREPLWW